MTTISIRLHWGISRARETEGYTICSLYEHDKLSARCNGGGYDMRGTVFGNWLAKRFPEKLLRLRKPYYGLSFHDPTFDPGTAVAGKSGETVAELEARGDSLGLERYQAFYHASSPTPTKRHVIPLIDGACGISSVMDIANAVGISIRKVGGTAKSKDDWYEVTISEARKNTRKKSTKTY